MLKDRDKEIFVAKRSKKIEEKVERGNDKPKPIKEPDTFWHGAKK